MARFRATAHPAADPDFIEALLMGGDSRSQWGLLENSGLVATTVSAGEGYAEGRSIYTYSPGSDDTAVVQLVGDALAGFFVGQDPEIIDWSKEMWWVVVGAPEGGGVSGVCRFSVGAAAADAVAVLGTDDLDDKGIGFRMSESADNEVANPVIGFCHDGTTLTTVDLGFNIYSGHVQRVAIHSDGLGKVTWWRNNLDGIYTLMSASAGGPTGLSTAKHNQVRVEVAFNVSGAPEFRVQTIHFQLDQG
jgi:hypothetical protein